MDKEKMFDSPLVVPKSVGLTRAIADLAKKMTEHHKARSLSDYIRGLVLLDALIVEGTAQNIRTSDLPTWFMNEFTPDFLRKMKADYAAQNKTKSANPPKGVSLDDLKKW